MDHLVSGRFGDEAFLDNMTGASFQKRLQTAFLAPQLHLSRSSPRLSSKVRHRVTHSRAATILELVMPKHVEEAEGRENRVRGTLVCGVVRVSGVESRALLQKRAKRETTPGPLSTFLKIILPRAGFDAEVQGRSTRRSFLRRQ